MRLVVAVLAGLLLPAATASAATVRVVPRAVEDVAECPSGTERCSYYVIEYRGMAGEANSLEVSAGGADRTLRLRDTGADIAPGTGCRSEGPRQVRCEVPAQALYHELEAFMGDMADDVSLTVEVLNLVRGGAGDDLLIGSTTTDRFDGGAGRDQLFGGDGADFLDDTGPGTEGDVFAGGEGTDEISYRTRRGAVKVDLRDPAGSGGQAGEGDTFSGIETIRGGSGDDVLRAGDGRVLFYGGPGHDRLSGGDGDDFLTGETGNDTIRGGFGRDWLHGEEGNDGIDGGCDADIQSGGTGRDRLYAADGSRDKLGGGPGTDFARFDQADLVRHVERRERRDIDGCAL
jgi:Ca2+-binding RTX toxin-like protein